MRSSRTALLPGLALALALSLAGSAAAQSPDVPSGPARVEGRLVHAERPEAAAGLEVLLYALSADGGAGLRATTSDAEGRFAFEGISNDAGVVYLVGARSGDVPFGKRFRFEPGRSEQEVLLELTDPVSDTRAARTGAAVLRLQRGCTHLRVEHGIVVVNTGEQVIFVPEEQRAGIEPLLEVEIPADVEGFESLLGTSGLERDGDAVRFWGPLYPGEQEIAFGYGQPLEREHLALGFPRGAASLEVIASPEALTLEAAGLEVGEEEDDGLHRLRQEGLAPGARIELRATPTARGVSPLRATRAEVWLELDDAALDVSERIEVVAPEALAGDGPPLLCLPLPPGARGLRFSDATLGAGLRRDPSGDLALHGPLPEGPTQVALSYRLPATANGARYEAAFDRALPMLSVLVADTGIAAETDRLHRRRPIRSEDRLYLHWEAFAVEPGERIVLGLRPLSARTGGGWTATGFALLAGLASLGFLLAPLRDAGGEREVEHIDPSEPERLALARALADLEEDLETGKLDDADHAALRGELMARAAALEARAPDGPTPTAAPGEADVCPACGAGHGAGDRFCSQCGAALAGGARSA